MEIISLIIHGLILIETSFLAYRSRRALIILAKNEKFMSTHRL